VMNERLGYNSGDLEVCADSWFETLFLGFVICGCGHDDKVRRMGLLMMNGDQTNCAGIS